MSKYAVVKPESVHKETVVFLDRCFTDSRKDGEYPWSWGIAALVFSILFSVATIVTFFAGFLCSLLEFGPVNAATLANGIVSGSLGIVALFLWAIQIYFRRNVIVGNEAKSRTREIYNLLLTAPPELKDIALALYAGAIAHANINSSARRLNVLRQLLNAYPNPEDDSDLETAQRTLEAMKELNSTLRIGGTA